MKTTEDAKDSEEDWDLKVRLLCPLLINVDL
jgi:hypothetical protein